MAGDPLDNDVLMAGGTLLNHRRVMLEMAGASRFSAALERLEDERRAEYDAATAVSWIRVSTQYQLVYGLADLLARDPAAFQRDVVRTSLEQNFRTVWRVLLHFTSDEALVARATSILTRTFRPGRLDAKMLGPGRCEITASEMPCHDDYPFRGTAVGIEVVLGLTGRKDARVSYVRRGHEGAAFHASWR